MRGDEEIGINSTESSQIMTMYANPCYGDHWWRGRTGDLVRTFQWNDCPPGRTFYRSMVASLPEIWPKLHESEIEPINIDINSALDWGWKENPVFPSVHSLVRTYNWEMQGLVDPNPGWEGEEDVFGVPRKKGWCMTGDDWWRFRRGIRMCL